MVDARGRPAARGWSFQVAIQFAHRAMALRSSRWRSRGSRSRSGGTAGRRPACAPGASALVSLLALQIFLGALIIRTYRAVGVTTGPRAGGGAHPRCRLLAHVARPPRRDRGAGPRHEATQFPRMRASRDYLELTKPRLSLLSVMTALVGYVAARPAVRPARVGLLVRRHLARRRRRRLAQPVDGERHGRAHAAHGAAADPDRQGRRRARRSSSAGSCASRR